MRKSPGAVVCTLFCLILNLGAGPQVRAETVLGATPTGILVWLAEQRGYFQSVPGGLRVREFQSGTTAAHALLEGEIALATSSEFAFGSNAMRHSDLRALAAISASRTCHLFTRADRAIKTVRDLKGRRIGVTAKSIGEYFLGQTLVLAGMDLDAVEIVNLKPGEIVSAIAAGDIDAAMTWEPNIFTARQALGPNFRQLQTEDDRYYYFLLTARAGWVQENPLPSTEILRALIKAERFAAQNPAEAKSIIRARFSLDPAYLDQLWPQHSLLVSLPQDLLFVLEEGIRWRIQEGLSSGAVLPDVSRFVHLEPLKKISPANVGVIH